MSTTDPHDISPPRDDALTDAFEHLDALRDRLEPPDPSQTADQTLEKLSETVERLSVEHAGMAEELLGVYEQLGVVFEVTAKLPSVQTESEVIDLFLDSLRRSFANREVFVINPKTVAVGGSHGAGALYGSWVDALILRAKERSSVIVESPPPETQLDRVSEVMVGPVFAGRSFAGAIVLTAAPGSEAFRASDMLLLESLAMFCGDLIRNHRLVHEVREMSLNLVHALVNAVDQKDTYTSGHSVRVGYFAWLLGEALNLKEHELEMLRWGALLHDVGKIGIRDDVLKKKGRLDADEYAHIKEHPVRSHKVVCGVPQLSPALDGILHHHERFDGSGYPDRLVGEAIPLQARIIQIADIFDALTSDRAYRGAHPWQEALEILKQEAGKSVDPKLQSLFDELIHQRLDDSPNGWEDMTHTANRFRHSVEGPTLRVKED